MSKNTILITGASGNIGSKVAEALVDRHAVIVSGRNTERLERFKGRAQLMAGDLEDEGFLKELLGTSQLVFFVMPVLRHRSLPEFADLFIKLAAVCKVSHVVNISNCTLTRGGTPTSLIEFEHHLSQAKNVHMKHLRCANFFENLNWGLHTPYKPDIKLPYISSYEVAHIAAQYLAQLNFSGISVDELMGRKDYSMKDFADQLGVAYRQVEATAAFRSFFEAFNSGNFELTKRTSENTSKLRDDKFSLEYFLNNDFNKSYLTS